MQAIAVTYGREAYEAKQEQERQARLARHAAESVARQARERQARSIALFTRPMPTSEETCARIQSIVSRQDVREQEASASRFRKSVKFFSGGAVGLGR
jgi:hypothetical protein